MEEYTAPRIYQSPNKPSLFFSTFSFLGVFRGVRRPCVRTLFGRDQ